MTGLGIFLILLAVLCVIGAAMPRKMWWGLSSWMYRNPDANEPSDAGYGIQSIILGIVAVLSAIAGIAAFVNESPDERAERRANEADECSELADRFYAAAEFNDNRMLENPDDLEALAAEQALGIEISASPASLISVRDGDTDGATTLFVFGSLGMVRGCDRA